MFEAHLTWLQSLGLLGALALAIHTCGAALALHAIFYTRTPQGSVAWALLLTTLPYFTIPLYLVFGRSKFRGYIETRRSMEREMNALLARLQPFGSLTRADLPGDGHRFEPLEKLAKLPFTRGNSLRLLIDGEATFAAIFAGIDRAQRYLLIQFFIFHDDELGRALEERLLAAAARGVKIYFLYDELGSRKLGSRYVNSLKAAGIQVRRFGTTIGWANRLQINFRNHRKIVVVDGETAYIGGHNVGDEYVGRSKFGHWRDTHVQLDGPAVLCAQHSFLEDWFWATRELPELEWEVAPAREQDRLALVLASSPTDPLESCTLFFIHAINSARQRLWITSPYFVPDLQVMSALQVAALRGVDVRILLPSRPDHLLVYLSGLTYVQDIGSEGVKFFRYQDGFLHQKVMLIDDDFAAIGTANLDNRSFRLNFEVTVACYDRAFAGDVAEMLERDFARSKPALPADVQRRAFPVRLAARVARLMAPIQ